MATIELLPNSYFSKLTDLRSIMIHIHTHIIAADSLQLQGTIKLQLQTSIQPVYYCSESLCGRLMCYCAAQYVRRQANRHWQIKFATHQTNYGQHEPTPMYEAQQLTVDFRSDWASAPLHPCNNQPGTHSGIQSCQHTWWDGKYQYRCA
jgi:hypothetical protein